MGCANPRRANNFHNVFTDGNHVLTLMSPTTQTIFGRLRLRQLALVIALDKHRSMRKAAAELSMTQSALSKALGEMEVLLGAALFERSKGGLVPNALGQCVVRYAWLLRADVNAMCDELAQIRSGGAGRLTVGAIMGAVPALLADAIHALRRDDPHAAIEIVEGTSAHLLSSLDQGQLDVVIGRTTVSAQPHAYHYERLADEPLAVACGPQHPLARVRKVALTDLRTSNWIVYPSQMPLRVLLEHELQRAGIDAPVNLIETASTFATVALLRDSTDLVALLPHDVCQFFCAHNALRELPIALQSRSQPFGIVTRASGALPGIAQRFIDALKEAATRRASHAITRTARAPSSSA
jgi:DNA-binding transcriptional LysR family regulator